MDVCASQKSHKMRWIKMNDPPRPLLAIIIIIVMELINYDRPETIYSIGCIRIIFIGVNTPLTAYNLNSFIFLSFCVFSRCLLFYCSL